MIYKRALTDHVPLDLISTSNDNRIQIGLVKTASGKIFIEPNSEKAKRNVSILSEEYSDFKFIWVENDQEFLVKKYRIEKFPSLCILNDMENCFDEIYDDGFQLGKLGQLFDTMKENTEASLAKSKLIKSIKASIDSFIPQINSEIKDDVIIASLIEILSKSLAELEISPMDVIQTYMPRIMSKIAGCKVQQVKM